MEERGIPDRVEMIRPSDGNEFEIRCHADQFVGIGLSWIKLADHGQGGHLVRAQLRLRRLRNLRPIANQIDWDEQRRLFQELTRRSLGLRPGE